jgi:hypothetical protein
LTSFPIRHILFITGSFLFGFPFLPGLRDYHPFRSHFSKGVDMNPVPDESSLKIIADIEEKIIEGLDLGFDPQILKVLDDMEADKREIEAIKEKISEATLIRLLGIANSVYYGKLRKGNISTFGEAVLRLGMEHTKIFIISHTLFNLTRDKEVEVIAARSFATSILGGILAKNLGFSNEDVKKIELAGLFLEIGKIIILLYQKKGQREGKEKGFYELDKTFLELYHSFLALKIILKFELPEFLSEMIDISFLSFKANTFSLSGIVYLAHCLVVDSFKKFNKLVIQSPMPDKDGILTWSYGAMVEEQFRAVGMGSYLEIKEVQTPLQKRFQEKESYQRSHNNNDID